jgi:triosephosphate isomerase
MANKKIVIANWKMNKLNDEISSFAKELNSFLTGGGSFCDVVICPPFPYIHTLKNALKNHAHIGAQNAYFEDKGAYTGEVSCKMLKDIKCEYVILGHSERRQFFHESNEIVNKKVLKALETGLIPVLCVGETLQEHQDKLTEGIIEDQVFKCLNNVHKDDILKLIIAYEPVWAIGTGKNATPHQAELVHNFIRKKVKKLYDEDTAKNIRIVYGGSINAGNAKDLFSSDTIDGGLVGGASLEVGSYIELIKFAS